MAPRDSIPKPIPKVQRVVVKANTTKGKSSPIIKKNMSTVKKTTEKIPKIPLKLNNTTTESRQRTATVPKVSTPKTKDKTASMPGSVTKSVKKSTWKRRPKPAHSGVPVPEKMKRILERQLQDMDSSL
ncbi:uncharacterized protein LOC115443524 [Manduca sexta]|uniref:Uncharacterized protein n=1 Tax=Manduca sexta TaxID=7130 RepID=A0A922CKY8_MANSE|nr:uncharacterized protein LOC115443524 [Manduca sexta]KAG6450142.1 hypothetical protein O3G_MSEX006403 [Manduca sexta]